MKMVIFTSINMRVGIQLVMKHFIMKKIYLSKMMEVTKQSLVDPLNG